MTDAFQASIKPAENLPDQAYWFIFSNHQLLIRTAGDSIAIPIAPNPGDFGLPVSSRHFIGTLHGRACYAVDQNFEHIPDGFAFEDLRILFDGLEKEFYETALAALHLAEWDKNCRFCSVCAGEMKLRTDVRAKECRQCGRLEFPRLSPAIIVLIEKEDTVLLARSPRFKAPFFSTLAGFVEPGESLEEAVRREVLEEVGISVKNIRYFSSQPWPFPDSLMIGFTAQHESGEIRIDPEEIAEADWYKFDNLPMIPGKLSIARMLIDWFIAKHKP
jgi:NAD+ diphosphatase